MQHQEIKPSSRRLLILHQSGLILLYRPDGYGDRLGSLEKRILRLLLRQSLHAGEIARRLGAWHNHVHVSLRKLARKGIVESWTALFPKNRVDSTLQDVPRQPR